MKKFQSLFLFSGPGIFFVTLVLLWTGLTGSKAPMIGILLWMLIWWTTQVVPIAITSLLPVVLFPLLNILDLKSTCLNYANPVIFLFFGGFVLGIAIEKWGLHKRIALNIIKASGVTPRRIVLGTMIASAFLSMWISNTATTLMMLPIGLSILAFTQPSESNNISPNFSAALLLGIAYSANIGGMATLIGTPPNLVLAGMASDQLGIQIDFSTWFVFAFPLVCLLFILVFLINTNFLFPLGKIDLRHANQMLKTEIKTIGKAESGEKRVAVIFVLTALAWIFRIHLNKIEFLAFLSDHIIAISATIILFLTPSGKGQNLMMWRDAAKIPWEILLLFGGGLAIAQGMSQTGIMSQIGENISGAPIQSLLSLILLVTFVSIFMTEVMSNVALVSVFIPISFGLATGMGISGMGLSIPITLAASCAFMFPISTPPNAIVYSSKKIKMTQMIKAGLILNVLAALCISLYYWGLGETIF